MADEIKLLGMWASPFSRMIELVLKLKGLQFDYSEEDLSNKSDLLLKSNPVHKKIHVFFHNGKPISESLVIIEYIDETWGNDYSILPTDPYDRAIARFWAKFVDDKVLPTAFKAVIGKDKEREDALEEFSQQITFLEGQGCSSSLPQRRRKEEERGCGWQLREEEEEVRVRRRGGGGDGVTVVGFEGGEEEEEGKRKRKRKEEEREEGV